MPELRKDYILDEWVIIATERGKRPHDFKVIKKQVKEKVCYFCPGNEEFTPNEIYRIEKNKKWYMRVFSNKFPAVKSEGNFKIQTDNKFYTFSNAFGYHEIVVETPLKTKQIWDLSEEDLKLLFNVYTLRTNELSNKEGINYVEIFKNHGAEAGTSVIHSHSQIIAYNKVPERIEKEAKFSNINSCAYCEIIQKEKNSERRCFENDSFVAFTPYASRFPFEIWIFPKQHFKYLNECNYNDLAKIFKQVLKGLKELNASFNYIIHSSPTDIDNLHFHIEFLPRLTTWAGFEYSGTIINPMPPENAARFYRGETKD